MQPSTTARPTDGRNEHEPLSESGEGPEVLRSEAVRPRVRSRTQKGREEESKAKRSPSTLVRTSPSAPAPRIVDNWPVTWQSVLLLPLSKRLLVSCSTDTAGAMQASYFTSRAGLHSQSHEATGVREMAASTWHATRSRPRGPSPALCFDERYEISRSLGLTGGDPVEHLCQRFPCSVAPHPHEAIALQAICHPLLATALVHSPPDTVPLPQGSPHVEASLTVGGPAKKLSPNNFRSARFFSVGKLAQEFSRKLTLAGRQTLLTCARA